MIFYIYLFWKNVVIWYNWSDGSKIEETTVKHLLFPEGNIFHFFIPILDSVVIHLE